MTTKSPKNSEGKISIEEAKREGALSAGRVALLHLSFAKAIVEELGEKKGKQLILKAIKDYGIRIGERRRNSLIAQGLDPTPENASKSRDLAKYGMHDRSEPVEVEGEQRSRVYGCNLARVWKEYGEEELGRLYCFVDLVKYMAFLPELKLVHTKTIPDGDDYCEMAVRPTSEKEREDLLDSDNDWTYIYK